MKRYLVFLWECFRLSFVGGWRYHLWMLVLTLLALCGLHAYCQQFVNGLVTTGMTDQVSLGALHRQLHLPGGPGRRGRDAGDSRLCVSQPALARRGHLRRAVGGGGDRHVPALRHGRSRPARPLPALALAIQLPDLDAHLGRHRPERLPAVEPAHLRLPDLLRLSRPASRPSSFTCRLCSSPSSGR